MQKKIEIAPSILSADFRHLEEEVKRVEDSGADRIHCDIMDGHFVPNITFGPIVVEAVRKCVTIPLDVHLMITNPEKYIKNFCDAGSDILIIHAETVSDLPSILSQIKRCHVKTGVTVNPDKPLDLFIDHLPKIDQVMIMTVYAGFSGQKFIPEMVRKTKHIYDEAARQKLSIDIEVDGGINHETAEVCAKNGATIFVAGSYIFNSQNYQERITALRESALRGRKSP
jgi:ribulose-phosphate 3-epimerase